MRLALPVMLLAGLALTGCSNPESTERYLIDPPDLQQPVGNTLGTAELRDVSLPEYAEAGEVSWQTQDGAVRSNSKRLWADEPERAFTLTLARSISEMSGATVIAEPWPLAEPPRRRIEVRVEKALAQFDGIYRLQGAYYVADERAGGANHARRFDIQVALPVAQKAAGSRPGALFGRAARAGAPPTAIAAAQNQAIAQLARQIAVLGGPGDTITTSTPAPDSFFDSAPLLPLEPLPPLEPADEQIEVGS